MGHSPCYQFLLNMWILKKATETQIRDFTTYGYITQAECDEILATPQTGVLV
jgi:hypothetical protein